MHAYVNDNLMCLMFKKRIESDSDWSSISSDVERVVTSDDGGDPEFTPHPKHTGLPSRVKSHLQV